MWFHPMFMVNFNLASSAGDGLAAVLILITLSKALIA